MIEIKDICTPDGIRSREISGWSVIECGDEAGTWWALTGFVDSGINERPLAEGATCRFTKSSEIVRVRGRIITTKSGSTYKLIGDPSPCFETISNYDYNPEDPLSFLRV